MSAAPGKSSLPENWLRVMRRLLSGRLCHAWKRRMLATSVNSIRPVTTPLAVRTRRRCSPRFSAAAGGNCVARR